MDADAHAPRRPRADAERNRLRLLATAKTVFAEKGARASLNQIAKAAGIGAGTLYRHFPTRDALIEAVYLNETRQFADAAGPLSSSLPPVEALREWLLIFVDYIVTKRLMAETLYSIAGGPGAMFAQSWGWVKAALKMLTDRAAESGDLSLNFDSENLLRALASVAINEENPIAGQAAARQMIDVLLVGLRTPQSG
jgi:AcrR family transcriptional regulator